MYLRPALSSEYKRPTGSAGSSMLCCSLPCGRREWRDLRHNWTGLIEAIGREDNDNMAKWINSNSHDLATEKYFPEGHGQMWLWKLNGTNQLMHCGRGFSAQVLRVLPFDKITQIIYIIYLPVGTCFCYPPPPPPPPPPPKKKKSQYRAIFSDKSHLVKIIYNDFFLHLFHSIVSQHYRFHVENKPGHLNTFY